MGPCGPGVPPNIVSVLVDAVTGRGGGGCCALNQILHFSLQALFTTC